jgi:hypothetical protein
VCFEEAKEEWKEGDEKEESGDDEALHKGRPTHACMSEWE